MISIIITAYNVARTILRAIDSCINQTYKNLEILIIEDCSTDNTLDIIKSNTDPRIRLIQQEFNQGAGMARRRGTKEAKGEYTAFLDGDDYYEPDFIEIMYKLAKDTKSDIVSCGVNIVKNEIITKVEKHQESKTYVDKEVLFSSDNSWIKRYLNNKLVKRSLWNKVEYSDRRFIEDTQTCFFLLYYCKRFTTTIKSGYNYVQNPESLCHTNSNHKRIICMALCAKDICEFLKKNNSKYFIEAMKAFITRCKNIEKLKLTEEELKEYSQELAEIFIYFLSNTNF